jgi:hypothetical protein
VQIPDWHWPFPVQLPPLATPQSSLLGSQTPDTHAWLPTASLVPHAPPGTGAPLAVFASQTPAPLSVSHQSPAAQSESTVQAVPQAPVVVLHNGPPWLAPVQLALVAQTPQVPDAVQ